MNITPFQFEDHNVRVVLDDNGETLFVGKDVCETLGYADPTTAIRSHCRGAQILHPIPDAKGRAQPTRVLTEADVLRLIVSSTLPAAEAFERWIFEDVLPSIRKTGRYAMPGSTPAQSAIAPAKEFEALFGVARLIGLDQNAAALSANQAVTRITGTDMLQLLGTTHLVSEQQVRFYTPTELGDRLGISGRKFNMLLAEAGLQAKEGDAWKPLPAAESFFRLFDTGKRHGGVMVQQLKWADNVLHLVQPEAA